MQGYVQQISGFINMVQQSSGNVVGEQMLLTLITRRMHNRVGTKHISRGIDDLGFVANQCETEQILTIPNKGIQMSHVQIRGSVPCFWDQKGLKEEIFITRTPELTKKPFNLNFKDIIDTYG